MLIWILSGGFIRRRSRSSMVQAGMPDPLLAATATRLLTADQAARLGEFALQFLH